MSKAMTCYGLKVQLYCYRVYIIIQLLTAKNGFAFSQRKFRASEYTGLELSSSKQAVTNALRGKLLCQIILQFSED